MNEIPAQDEKVKEQPEADEAKPFQNEGGVSGPTLATVFVVFVILGLVMLPSLGASEFSKEILDGSRWWAVNLGEYHPIILHLPIGIVFLTVVMEMCGWVSRGRYRPMTAVGLFLGFVTGAVACVTGFFDLSVEGLKADDWDDAWYQHMWLGIIFVGVLGLAFLAKIWGGRSQWRGVLYGIFLFAAVGLMGYGAHIGGVKVHKTDPVENTLKGLNFIKEDEPEEVSVDLSKQVQDRLAFAEVIVPIMDAKCFSCHSEAANKSKGGLYMDTYEDLLIGGDSQDEEEYRTLVPGDASESYMIGVLHLPLDDDLRMPPPKKEQMEAHEIELLTWWVNAIPVSETLQDQTLAEMGAPQHILDAANRVMTVEQKAEMEEKAKAEKEERAAAKEQELKLLRVSVTDLQRENGFQNALKFVSPSSADLEFSARSLGGKLTDEDLGKLESVAAFLISLDLGTTSVTESRVLDLLGKMPNLRELNLSQTEVGDGLMSEVGKLEHLESLNLYGTQVSDAGLMKLKSLVNLKKLFLWQSRATPEGGGLLQKELPALEINYGVN